MQKRAEFDESRQENYGIFSCAIVFLVVGLMLSCFFLAVRRYSPPELASTMLEMHQIEMALELYKRDIGSFPPGKTPALIQSHIKSFKPGEVSFEAFEAALPHDISKLDDREILPVWLGGSAWAKITRTDRNHFGYFDFYESRLVDTDADGWLEYHDRLGNHFIFRDDEVRIRDRKTGEEKSLRELESHK